MIIRHAWRAMGWMVCRIYGVLKSGTTLVLRGGQDETPVDVHRGQIPRRYGLFVVHAVDGHSNKSAHGLESPSASELEWLVKQAPVVEPPNERNPPPKPMARNLRRRLAPEVREAIVSRYVAGESAKALSQEFGISRDGVRRLLKHAGVAIRTQTVVAPEVTQQIVGLYANGLTIRQVAARVGCAYGTVRGVLHESDAVVRVSPVGRGAVSGE